MILVADSGATKTHWALISEKSVVREIYTPGFNPYYYEPDEFERSLSEELAGKVPAESLKQIFFYGSGISSDVNKNIVKNALKKVFPEVKIETYHDLHGAAIALFGNEKGIACILGTGSNSCLWDGHSIIANVPSLGYFLGDEGSGTYIGKLFVKDVLSGNADQETTNMFYDENKLTFSTALDQIYKEPNPNQFFAKQTKLLRNCKSNAYCQVVVSRAFDHFVKEQLFKYPGYDSLPVCFIGSIATNFKDILKDVLGNHNIKLGKVMKEPMEGLIEYHIGHSV